MRAWWRWSAPPFGSSRALKPSFSLCNCNCNCNCNSNSSSNYNITTKIKASASEKLMATKIEESDVGIFCYISPLPGFRGILKQRYSDFIVNEVDPDSNVVHLTSLDAPVETPEENGHETKNTGNKSYTSEIELFRSLAGDSDADCLESYINKVNSEVDDSIFPIVLSPDSDKSHRTAIHNFFKERFKKLLVTDTVDGPDSSSKCIRIRLDAGGPNNKGRHSRKRKERGDKPFDSRGSDSWPEHMGKFIRFHLYKENKDTQEALGVIGKMLGIQPKSFGFAGTKDKRSVSTQRVTVFKLHARRLAALNERLIGIKIGDFCFVKEGLVLGQLLGNRFTITLRGVVADSEETIKASASALGRLGFINYFGLQRFGSGSVPTYLLGAALLRGEWKTAVNMVLNPREGERIEISKAREYYKETNDIEGTLRQLPRYLVAERAILQCLKKCPGNYLQALKAIPRTLRMMYVHSYQSYLWNNAASMRVQKYGTERVVVGDLVYNKGECTESTNGVLNSECEVEDCGDAYDSGHLDEIPETDLTVGNQIVKAVTKEDILVRTYTIDDVILPLPGSRVNFPENDIAEVYHDLAEKDSISLKESVHNVKEFSITGVTGSYRRVFQKPMDFEWELLRYSDSNLPLAETDLDRISKSRTLKKFEEENLTSEIGDIKSSDCIENSESLDKDLNIETDNDKAKCSIPNGSNAQESQTALKLSFTLPSSCYATMAIRELLKTSTSVAFHKTLN